MKAFVAAALLAAIALPTAASAGHRHGHGYHDRHASPHEWRQVVRKLHRHGFYKWDEIELEKRGTVWEVDDAIHHSGHRYDLWMARGSLHLIRKDRER